MWIEINDAHFTKTLNHPTSTLLSRRHFLRRSIAFTAMALSSIATVPVWAAKLKPINVKEFGAKGDGVTDDTAAINAAIVAAQKQGAGAVVSLPSGRYKTALGKEKSIRITGADGLAFQGEGDTIIVSGDLDEPVFRIVDSKSVTVRKISIDHDPLGYTQGTITSVDIPNMTCEVSIDPGYPAPNDPTFKGSQVHPFVFPENHYYQLDRHWPNPIEMVKTGEHTWSWKLQGPPNIDNWSNYTRIIEQRDKRTLIVQAKNSDYRAGDRVELWDWQHKKMRSNAIITTATRNPDGTFVITLDRDVVTEHVGVGIGMNFSRESMTDGIDRLINVATVGQETTIRDSKFQVFRAKCLNLKATHCTIERCTFSNSFQPAISAAPEWYFKEGSSIRNFTVRDCTFTDNNHPNIVIGASPLSGVPGTKPMVSDAPENISHDSTNILIEGNSFSGFGTTPSVFGWNWPVGAAITITNAADVMIRGNKFGPLAESAPQGTPKILVEKSRDVQVMNNKGISAKEAETVIKKHQAK